VGVLAYLLFTKNTVPTDGAMDGAANEQPAAKTPAAQDYQWNLTELAESPVVPGMPRTGVTLTSGGKTYPVGEFDGSCFVIEDSSWTLLPNEKTGVICWFAGGGSEAGVFEQDGKFFVRVGYLDEGSEEIAGTRGGFEQLFEVTAQ
jgi:hypothetical protein